MRVRTPQPDELARAARAAADVDGHRREEPGLLEVVGLDAAEIGEAAARPASCCTNSPRISASLEEAYLALTQDDVEYRTEVAR